MRIPPPPKPIDVEDAWEHIQRGMTVAEYARQSGRSRSGVLAALHRAGHRNLQKPAVQRDDVDRHLYSLWSSLRRRCTSPASPQYVNYGAVGIRMCRAWDDFVAFRDWSRANGYHPRMALLRRVPSRGFSPGNCRWTSLSEVVSVGLARGTRRTPPSTVKAIPWDRVQDLYVRDGQSVAVIVNQLGISRQGLTQGLIKRGWKRDRVRSPMSTCNPAIASAWVRMVEECSKAKSTRPRGSVWSIDPQWGTFEKFLAWSSKSGFRPGLVLTRLDRRHPFGPKNCAWMTRSESIEFHRPTKVTRTALWKISGFGETKSAAEWARDARCVVSSSGLTTRLRNGWDAEDAITTLPKKKTCRDKIVRRITAFGMTASLVEWAADRRARVSGASISRRIDAGMSPEAAITTPPFQRRQANENLRNRRSAPARSTASSRSGARSRG